MPIATVTSKGQVTIPVEVRDRLRLRSGDRLEFVVEEDGTVTMRKRSVDLLSLVGRFRAERHVTVEEMNEAIASRGAGK